MATTSTLDLINSPDSIISITTDTDSITIVTGDQGPVGLTGARGVQGVQGIPGLGVASGGFVGQALVKSTNNNYDTSWKDLFDSASPGPIGSTQASTGRFTTIQSTVSTGTPPFIVSSTTPVNNLSIGGNAATATNVPYSGLTGTVPIWNQNTTGTASNITGTYTGSITSSQVTTALSFTPENLANKGAANGYAPLDSSTKIAATYLPSYVDDVVEYSSFTSLPATGETGKIYTTIDTNKIYRWGGSAYIEISAAPGSTDAVIEGTINKYYTDTRARASISVAANTNLSYDSTTGVITGPNLSSYLTSVTPSNFSSQTAKTILAAPNGSDGTPTFRLLVASDIPTLNQSTTGNAATVTNGVYTTDTGTVTNTMLAGSIANDKLSNSTITFGSTSQALGSTVSALSGVTLNNGIIGGTTPAAGTFTTISLPSQASAPSTPSSGFVQYASSAGMFSWKGTNGFVRQFDASSITADRTWILPDNAGTIALTSNLGTIASQNANGVTITGGSINGTSIGASTASSGAFTTLSAQTALAISSGGTGKGTATAAQANLLGYTTTSSNGIATTGASGTGATNCATGSITGSTLTIGGSISGNFVVGMVISGTNVTPGTMITAMLTGSSNTAGSTFSLDRSSTNVTNTTITSTGAATLTFSNTASGTSSSISGTVLTVGGTITGAFFVGMTISGSTTLAGTTIVSLGTGVGGAGTYNLSQDNGTITSTTITGAITTPPFAAGSYIAIAGISPGGYAGMFQVNSSTTTSVTYTNATTGAQTTGGTITTPWQLSNTSSFYQIITGTTFGAFALPDTSTLQLGWTYRINNAISTTLNLYTSTGFAVGSLAGGSTGYVTCINTSINTTAAWRFGVTEVSATTGTGSMVLSTSPSIAGVTITGTLSINGSTTSTSSFHTTQTTASMSLGGTTATGIARFGQSTLHQPIQIGSGATVASITATGTGSISSTTLSVTSASNTFSVGMAITGTGVLPGTYITVLLTGTGAPGSASTFTISRDNGTVTSTTITGTTQKSIDIGTNGVLNSITQITLGSATSGATSTTSINGTLNTGVNNANYVQIKGAASNSSPSIAIVGTDNDIQLSLVPKGLGIVLMNQQTPAAVTATGTLTIANLLTQIITSTSATAVSLTLPTGTLTDAGVSGGTSAVNTSFDWSIINLGSATGDVTLVAATGHTIVGSATVAIGTSGKFRCRKTAASTFVSYRV